MLYKEPVNPKRLHRVLNQLCPEGVCHILVVEDNSLQRKLICRELQSGGWQVVEAEHGLEALARLRDRTVDIILLDLEMPEMDGFEFVEAIQKDLSWREIPIVVLTGKDLSSADRLRLNGYVENIVTKDDHGLQGAIKNIQKVLRYRMTLDKKATLEER